MTRPAAFGNLIDGFVEPANRFPSREALVVDGERLSYLALQVLAAKIASAILRHEHDTSRWWRFWRIEAKRLADGYAGERMLVIDNGIDTERFRPNMIVRHVTRQEWGLGDKLKPPCALKSARWQ